MRNFAAAVLVSLSFVACGGGGDVPQIDPAAECIRLTKAEATHVVQCIGSTSQADYDHAYGLLMSLNACDVVKGLRDANSFINECIPAIQSHDCMDGPPIPSCQNQLQY